MKRLLLALILIAPTFGAAALPQMPLDFNPWPTCLPCPPPPDDPKGDFDQTTPDPAPSSQALR